MSGQLGLITSELILIKCKLRETVNFKLVLITDYNYHCSSINNEMINTNKHYGHHHVSLSEGRQ